MERQSLSPQSCDEMVHANDQGNEDGRTIGSPDNMTSDSSGHGSPPLRSPIGSPPTSHGLLGPPHFPPPSLALHRHQMESGLMQGRLSPLSNRAPSSMGSISVSCSSSSLTMGSRRISPGLQCLVCGDTSSGKHYGILACNGCSGFFKRSVRRKLIYRCQAGTGSCIVDKAHRNQCQACRLKKCMAMGMNKDAVQNERQPRNTATIRPEALAEMDQERFLREAAVAVGVFTNFRRPPLPLPGFVTAMTSTRAFLAPSAPQNSSSPFSSPSLNSSTSPLVASSSNGNQNGLNNNHPSAVNHNNTLALNYTFRQSSPLRDERDSKPIDLLNVGGSTMFGNNETTLHSTTNSSSTPSTSIPPPPPLAPTSSCSSSSSTTSSQVNEATLWDPLQESMQETAARLLFMAVKWAKNLPSFSSLAFRDQVILLEEVWAELFILNAVQWSLPLPSCPLLSPSAHAQVLTHAHKAAQAAQDIRHLCDVAASFRELAVDPAEFAYLKAIVLFRPVRGLKDSGQVESLQDQAQVMLSQHERAHYPARPARFGRLLLLLAALRAPPSNRIQSLFFTATIGNTPMEKILCDMYKS